MRGLWGNCVNGPCLSRIAKLAMLARLATVATFAMDSHACNFLYFVAKKCLTPREGCGNLQSMESGCAPLVESLKAFNLSRVAMQDPRIRSGSNRVTCIRGKRAKD